MTTTIARFLLSLPIALAAIGCETATTTTTTSSTSSTSEAEVRALLAKQADEWTKGALESFTSVYADDALFFSPSGETRGRDAITARYHKRYREGGAEMGALSFDVVEVRATEQMASAALRWKLVWKDGKTAQGLSIVVLARTADGWRIVEDASM